MQTGRTVVDNLLRGKPAERVALMDGPWTDTMLAWVRQGYPTHKVYKALGKRRWRPDDGQWEDVTQPGEYEEPVPAWQYFGYDMVGVGGWFDLQPIRDYDELVAETDEWEVRRNGAGASLKYWKHHMGTPEHMDFRMTSREIWERDYRPHLLDFDVERLGDLTETTKNLTEAHAASVWAHYGHQFVWETMRGQMGDLTLYQSLILDPGWIHDYNRVYTDFYKSYYRYIFEHVGLPDGMWMYEDMGYKNGLFASPKTFGELIFPYFREMIEFFHSYDLPVVLHSCGSVAAAMPLIVDVGFDALNPIERKAKDNDPFVLAEKWGDKLAFVGGFDVRVWETNDKDTVRREMINYLEGMKARNARLIFASDHSIPPTVNLDTYCYALELYREHMMY
jgi:uroporphyrinogen decarboxylase